MTDHPGHADAVSVDELPEATPHADLDPMLIDWRRIASIAWQGFLTYGRGAVLIHVDALQVIYTYQPGGPCRCFAQAVATYDPDQQAVVGVNRGGENNLYVVGGWPPPPEAYAAASAELLGATVH
jgi:hypothetical protein